MMLVKCVFTYGTIEEAAHAAVKIAAILNAGIEFDFNGIPIVAWKHYPPDDIVEEFRDRMAFQIASEKAERESRSWWRWLASPWIGGGA